MQRIASTLRVLILIQIALKWIHILGTKVQGAGYLFILGLKTQKHGKNVLAKK